MAFSAYDPRHDTYMSKTGKYFPASVINNNDPTQNFRIQCRVAAIDTGTSDADLPWCKQVSTLNTGSVAGIDIPAIGEQVWVFFPEETSAFRYVIGKNIIANSQLKQLIPNYPDGYASIDAMGTTLIADTKNKTYSFTFPDGSGFQYSAGTLNIYGNGNVNIKANQQLSIYGSSGVNIGGSNLVFSASSIEFNGNVTSSASSGASNPAQGVEAGTTVSPLFPPPVES